MTLENFSVNRHGFPCGSDGKESACNAGDPGLIPGNVPWRRKWQPTPVFFPGEFHGQMSPVGYNTWGHKKLDMTERLIHSFFFLFALMLLVREKDFRKKTKNTFSI